MAWIHNELARNGAQRDVRLARLVLKRLRALGYAAKLFDVRDIHGARLHPASLQCGLRFVLVRSVAYQLVPGSLDAQFIASSAAFVQRGSIDIVELCQWLDKS